MPGERADALARWEKKVGLSYEMGANSDAGGGRIGTLMQVMQAAERIGADYVNVYPEDVLKSTPGMPQYDPKWEAAMKYGVKAIGPKDLAESLDLANYIPPPEAMVVAEPSSRPARGQGMGRGAGRGNAAAKNVSE